ncbi:MAG TPA: hypothetical protein VFG23_15855 [Polyangia bacterium]|nr:hypothetical protein [Polyangia bacterium]
MSLVPFGPKLLVSLFLLAGACSGSGSGGTGTALSLAGRECSWPVGLNDAGAGGCRAERAIAQCTDSSGDSCFGLSNDVDCSGCGDGFSSPVDKCGADQYGVVCGSVGPSSTPIGTPPAGCTNQGATPAGTIFYCCPCN